MWGRCFLYLEYVVSYISKKFFICITTNSHYFIDSMLTDLSLEYCNTLSFLHVHISLKLEQIFGPNPNGL